MLQAAMSGGVKRGRNLRFTTSLSSENPIINNPTTLRVSAVCYRSAFTVRSVVMSSSGSTTKNDCPGRDQQQFARTERMTPGVMRHTHIIKSPSGPKISCAGEGQEQFCRTRIQENRQSHDAIRVVRRKNIFMGPASPMLTKARWNLPETRNSKFLWSISKRLP
jgi:hypothetical protein